ncbi:MAG TPA: HEAT repeat domain-containing protein [Terriglobales bacterium]|nr:HEAT repeat domain-containing protein [Terriglobales bacterium]
MIRTGTLIFALLAAAARLATAQGPAIPANAPAQFRLVIESNENAEDNDREDELYQDGQQYLDESKWDKALEKFTQVADMHGRRADAALYWKAYCLNKLGRQSEALSTISELRKQYPKSGYLSDAGSLEVEVRAASGRHVNPAAQSDEELKVLAINALMNSSHPEQAVPELEKILASNNSPRVKAQALFVLAQCDLPQARAVLERVARGQANPDLQRRAIEYLGANGSKQDIALMVDIYNNPSTSAEVKRRILDSFVAADAVSETLQVAQKERDPELRRKAIDHLGAMDAKDALHQMYQSSSTPEEKRKILESLAVADDVAFLGQVARTPGDPSLRRKALQALGITGSKESRDILVGVYSSEKDPEIRRAVIEGLFIQDDAHDLVALARAETDPQLKRALVEKLSAMDNKEARDYMLEILNK